MRPAVTKGRHLEPGNADLSFMDPLGAIISLYSLAVGVKQWLDDAKEKEVTLTALSNTVSQVCHILKPFQDATALEPTVVAGCMSISVVLTRIQQRLLALKEKKRRRSSTRFVDFLLPGDAVKSLRDEQHHLSQELTMFLLALSVLGYFRDREGGKTDDRLAALALSISNRELLDFWRKYIGDETLWAPYKTLVAALKQHLKNTVSDATCQKVIYNLDEYAIGGVSLSNLSQHVGRQSLAEFCQRFNDEEQPVTDVSTLTDSPTRQLSSLPGEEYPLLIWIDDNPDGNVGLLNYACKLQVQVIEFTSTASATAWIEANETLLHRMDLENRLRFITDNVRLENSLQGPFLNLKAGEYMLRYLRGRVFRAPVLVFCGMSILSTEFVKSYEAAGSTISPSVVERYISSLARKRRDDVDWRGFHVFP